MNLYIETNFIVEIVKGQEQSAPCQALLDPGLAEVTLCIPGFCLVEARNALRRDESRRNVVLDGLALELSQMEKTNLSLPAEKRQILESARSSFALASFHFSRRLEELIPEIRMRARVLSIDPEDFDALGRLMQQYELKAYDAYILAAILHDIRASQTTQSAFASRDTHFAKSAVVDTLASMGCAYLGSYWQVARHFGR